jgi:DNA-directed RNA polymerase subunit beta'
MKNFSAGVVGGGDITRGLPRVVEIFEARTPKGMAYISEVAGKVTVKEVDKRFEVVVKSSDGDVNYLLPFGVRLKVKTGDIVEPGSVLTEGSINPKDMLRTKGIKGVQDYLLKEVLAVYRSQDVRINAKHIEIIIRQLTNKVQIQNPGDSSYFIGQVTTINEFYNVCKVLYKKNQTLPTAINLVFSIDDVPSKTDSFLSAASFQGTKKILTDAAVKAQIDPLLGLKENVILGNLIPAGTGLKTREQILQAGKKAYNEEY